MLAVKSRKYSELFRPNYFVFGQSDAGNNWARGAELIDSIMVILRIECEKADVLQGFN